MAGRYSPDVDFVSPTRFVDSDHPEVVAWATQVVGDADDDRAKAVRLFYAVRDDIRYDPYVATSGEDQYRASEILRQDRNWCVPKAILLCAGSRAVGVPCRLGFADVKNHLASPKLLEQMGTDLFAFHGYVEFLLDGAWRKATPAFNIEMCTRFGVKPLDFDGLEDSLYHEFDVEGRRHMEYVNERGTFEDFPYDEMVRVFTDVYGGPPGDAAADQHDELFHG